LLQLVWGARVVTIVVTTTKRLLSVCTNKQRLKAKPPLHASTTKRFRLNWVEEETQIFSPSSFNIFDFYRRPSAHLHRERNQWRFGLEVVEQRKFFSYYYFKVPHRFIGFRLVQGGFLVFVVSTSSRYKPLRLREPQTPPL
jgi:hypothetical protein